MYKGKPVTGLSWSESIQYYFYTHWRGDGMSKRPLFGRRGCDIEEAVIAYNLWLAKKGSPTIAIETKAEQIIVTNLPQYELDNMADAPYVEVPYEQRVSQKIDLPEAELMNILYDMIRKNKAEVEKRLKIKFVVYNAGHNITLKDIGNCYFKLPRFSDETKLNSNQKMELAEIKKTWKYFCNVIEKDTIGDIEKADIIRYRDTVTTLIKGADLSTTTHRKYYEHVKRILNHALKDMNNVEVINQVKIWCLGQLRPPKKVIKNPAKMISAEDFKKLLEVSNVEGKALWLLSANCAYYSIDLVSCPMSALSIKNKTIIYRRNKTGEHRSAILWNETIDALQDYFETMPHTEGTIFIACNHHNKLSKFTISDKFIACSEKAGFPKKYIHPNFRDTAETICKIKSVPTASIDALMGHNGGIAANYIDPETYPEISKAASMCLHDYYFGELKVAK